MNPILDCKKNIPYLIKVWKTLKRKLTKTWWKSRELGKEHIDSLGD